MPLISVGDLIDQSWEHCRREFSDLMSVSGWFLLIALVNIPALALYPSASRLIEKTTLTGAESAGVALFAFSNWILAPILGVWVLVALIRLIRSQLSGRRDGLREAMADGARLFFPTVLVSVLVVLVLLGAIVGSFAPSLLLYLVTLFVQNGALTVLAGVLLIPSVFVAFALVLRWSVQYYFAPFAVTVDGVRGRAALPASRSAVEGRFWGVLLRLILPKLVFFLLGILAVSIVSFAFSLLTATFAGLNLDVQLRISTISASVLSLVAVAFLNPLIVTADVLLYQSLKR